GSSSCRARWRRSPWRNPVRSCLEHLAAQLLVALIARVGRRHPPHHVEAGAALRIQLGRGLLTTLAQQRLRRIEGDAEILRLQRQRPAKQFQRIVEAAQLVGPYALPVEFDGLSGAPEDGRITAQPGRALQYRRVV